VDSIRASYDQVMLVDAGGFFPDQNTPEYQDVASFLMDAMKLIGTDAVGAGDKELHFGYSFLKANIQRSGLPVVCANLFLRSTGKPALTPYIIKKVGTARVGIFGLMNDKAAIGPSQDSLKVADPTATAQRVIAEMKKKGATIIVLLSQLGKVESEDLAAAVNGIDVLVVGRANSLLMKGRMIKNTVACYGGEQGQYLGRTIVTLNPARGQATGDCEAFMLGPEVGERAEVAKLVKAFEDGFNDKMRKIAKERAAEDSKDKAAESPDRYLGAELCLRCHHDEGEQWKTTAHSLAWQTLVDAKQQTSPECISCHVVGYRKPGGFQGPTDVNKLANVQCESCHGMGTMHEAFANPHKTVSEQVCTTCHQGENDPDWNWEHKRAKIAHNNMSGETLKNRKGSMTKSPGSQ
jgi:hypothetical protein